MRADELMYFLHSIVMSVGHCRPQIDSHNSNLIENNVNQNIILFKEIQFNSRIFNGFNQIINFHI